MNSNVRLTPSLTECGAGWCDHRQPLVAKNGRAKVIRFATLTALCDALDCQPGELFHVELVARAILAG